MRSSGALIRESRRADTRVARFAARSISEINCPRLLFPLARRNTGDGGDHISDRNCNLGLRPSQRFEQRVWWVQGKSPISEGKERRGAVTVTNRSISYVTPCLLPSVL